MWQNITKMQFFYFDLVYISTAHIADNALRLVDWGLGAFNTIHIVTMQYTEFLRLPSLLPSGLPPRTFAWTVSSELLGFYFSLFCSFLGSALD